MEDLILISFMMALWSVESYDVLTGKMLFCEQAKYSVQI